MRMLFKTMVLSVLMVATTAPLMAEGLKQPTGPIILTVEGAITHTNQGDKAVFDRQMLESLGMQELQTKTPWTDGVPVFEGPLGSALLDAVGAQGQTMIFTALNDYSATVPVDDFRTYPVILAMKMDGKYLRVRDKGPLFIVYPFDTDATLNSEVIHNRSVWQIKGLRVE